MTQAGVNSQETRHRIIIMNLSAFVKSKSEFVLMIFGVLMLSTVNMIALSQNRIGKI